MQPDRFFLSLLLSARMRAWWLLWQARRRPLRAAVVLAVAAVAVAGLAVAASHGPARGCSFRPATVPGRIRGCSGSRLLTVSVPTRSRGGTRPSSGPSGVAPGAESLC